MSQNIGPEDVVMYLLEVGTEFIEPVLDDDKWIVRGSLQYGDDGKQGFTLRVPGQEGVPECFTNGGVVIFSNLQPKMVRNAFALGLDYLMRTGHISPEDLKGPMTPEAEA